jgi:hypothetical protein
MPAQTTHPACASLGAPLFGYAGKRIENIPFNDKVLIFLPRQQISFGRVIIIELVI